MTTILAIQGDDFCAIGSDSQWSDDYGRVGKMTQSKVVTVGKYFIGVAGDTRGANIIQYIFTPPVLPPNSQSLWFHNLYQRTVIVWNKTV